MYETCAVRVVGYYSHGDSRLGYLSPGRETPQTQMVTVVTASFKSSRAQTPRMYTK